GEGLLLGLVDRVLPAEEVLPAALAYAREVASACSPRSIATIKWQVNRHAEIDLQTALRESLALTDESLRAPDFAEGIRAYAERRAPAFPPLEAGEPLRSIRQTLVEE